jgi:hypothetical protein
MKSDMVTSIEEGRTTAIPNAVAAQEGKAFEGKLESIDAADCIVSIGVNLVDNHEVAGFFAKRAHGAGTKLVVIDPSENPLDARADHVMKPAAGSDPETIAGLMAAAAKLGMFAGPVAFDIEKTLANAVEKTASKLKISCAQPIPSLQPRNQSSSMARASPPKTVTWRSKPCSSWLA